MLENQSYETTFAANSATPYLARTLAAKGALLTHYFGIGHYSLDNYLALLSGQAPNDETQQDCLVFSEFRATAGPDANGQLPGSGCVYPPSVRALPDQLEAAGLTWKAYMEDMGNNPAREARDLRPRAGGSGGDHRCGPDRRPVRHQAQSVRLFSLHHR